MSKLLLIFLLGLLLVGSVSVYYYSHDNNNESDYDLIYFGPVPLEYDLEYFRETGITKQLDKIE